jgi:2-iminobutanoate/2-iminopropanoate deaminase
MSKRVVESKGAPRAVGPYSQGVEVGGWLFLSGQIPLDPSTGELVEGDIKAQTERVLENLRSVLEAAGMAMEDVVQVTVYMTDLGEFEAMNSVYARYFPQDPPARVTVGVASLPKGAGIEISLVAFKASS